jgi:hypothetical protein
MVTAQHWRSNWLVISPPGAVRVDVHRSAAGRRRALRSVRALPTGTPVVLLTPAPGAIRRCRAFAARAGIVAEREFLAFPSAAAPGCLVEDAGPAIVVFAQSILVAPPGAALAGAIEAVLGPLRAVRPWRLIRALAPGRVVVGRRT